MVAAQLAPESPQLSRRTGPRLKRRFARTGARLLSPPPGIRNLPRECRGPADVRGAAGVRMAPNQDGPSGAQGLKRRFAESDASLLSPPLSWAGGWGFQGERGAGM